MICTVLGERPESSFARYRAWICRGEIHSYIVICPKCGMAGDCVRELWTAAEQDGKLTLHPSILCSCGGHYFLTDGVLREV